MRNLLSQFSPPDSTVLQYYRYICGYISRSCARTNTSSITVIVKMIVCYGCANVQLNKPYALKNPLLDAGLPGTNHLGFSNDGTVLRSGLRLFGGGFGDDVCSRGKEGSTWILTALCGVSGTITVSRSNL